MMRRSLSNCLCLGLFAAAPLLAAEIWTSEEVHSVRGNGTVTAWLDGFRAMGVSGELTSVTISGWGGTDLRGAGRQLL